MRVNGDEGTPVPIPNTVVKLIYGDNTWLATAREDNSTRTLKSSLYRLLFVLSEKVIDFVYVVMVRYQPLWEKHFRVFHERALRAKSLAR